MTRREEFERIVDSLAEYEGDHADTLQFLITLVCDLQIALDRICAESCDSLACSREIADRALHQPAILGLDENKGLSDDR
ncbi:MAG: hypothetical protein ACREBD_04130 [Blastocatellia bacterium]